VEAMGNHEEDKTGLVESGEHLIPGDQADWPDLFRPDGNVD